MTRIVLFNKPYGVLCQFTAPAGKRSLGDFIDLPGVYPAGRLDLDSEGLVVLTDDGVLQHRISDPRHKLPKVYWAQVEGEPDARALARLAAGVEIDGRRTRPARVRRIDEPKSLWPRDPPVRLRRAIPTAWVELALTEGRNRQVRRMTAAVGFPTLRLIRYAVGEWNLDGLAPGSWRLPENAGVAPRSNIHPTPGRRMEINR
ncbi:MAG: pseudouridine synthase [Pseudomonadota bacterium]